MRGMVGLAFGLIFGWLAARTVIRMTTESALVDVLLAEVEAELVAEAHRGEGDHGHNGHAT